MKLYGFMTYECRLCYSARRWPSVALSGLSRNDFKGKNVLSQPDNPRQPGDYKWHWWTLSLSLSLFFLTLVLFCLCCSVYDVSSVRPEAHQGTNLPHITLAGVLSPLSSLPGEFHLKVVFLKSWEDPMKLPRARIHDVVSW